MILANRSAHCSILLFYTPMWAKADWCSDYSQKSFWCRTRTHFICLADLWPCLITCIHSDYSFLISLCKQELTGREIFRGAGAQIKTYPVIISQCLKCNYCIDLSWYILISLESSALFEVKQWTRYCLEIMKHTMLYSAICRWYRPLLWNRFLVPDWLDYQQ